MHTNSIITVFLAILYRFIDNMDRDALFAKLDKYLLDAKRMAEVAMKGYLHAMIHHRTVNLMDYVLKVSFIVLFFEIIL